MKAKPQPPMDVRLMNVAATALFAAGIVLLLAALLWWALRHPLFAISAITVQGDVAHNNPVTLRANVAPRLAGNFFTVNLATARAAFEGVPWVRAAEVRREFPNRLRVSLEEHRAVALWGAEGEDRLVNEFGEVFEANPGDVEADELPRLSGPSEQAALVLTMYRTLVPVFEP
ncbi:MAG: FtsQ-type POTRA domain-containing protein, partial [Comamonadaceae bacterium]